ncbi:MAG: carboxypeptidase regulatory-like domain-containing protein, partial [Abitibacteriaceae bacterium]|nr:carboxypeptidase regulatory-like domain-containing protein [Abditibacteriaceae bacterium]
MQKRNMRYLRMLFVVGCLWGAMSCGAISQVQAASVPGTILRTLIYHQISSLTASPGMPIMSANGNKIAFTLPPQGTEDPNQPNGIFVMNTDGTGMVKVDSYQSFCFCNSTLAISADGSLVASTDTVQLRVARADGSGATPLVAFDSNEINSISISGDGSKVFFRLYRTTSLRGSNPAIIFPSGIYVINVDGTGLRQIVSATQVANLLGITADEAYYFGNFPNGLASSYDGSHIAFCSLTQSGDGGFGQSLFGVNLDGSGLHSYLGRVGYVKQVAISSNGAKVGFTVTPINGNDELGVINFDGSGNVKLTDTSERHPGTGAGVTGGVQLSADGTKLLLSEAGLLYNTDGSGVVPLGIRSDGFSTDPWPAVFDGLSGATMNNDATKFAYLIQPPGVPQQLGILTLNNGASTVPTGSAPTISNVVVTPPYVLTQTRSSATVTAHVSTPNAFLRVTSSVISKDITDPDISNLVLFDDGTNGDMTAKDGIFTNANIRTDCCDVVGPRFVRIKAETTTSDGKRHATAVDVAPFAVVDRLPAPTITSFTPTTGHSGTVITIMGTNFIGATAVQFNGVNASSFTVDNIGQITATVPASAKTGRIVVVTPWGNATSATNLNLLQSPFITGQVTDKNGVGVPNVHVTRDNDTTSPVTVLTDAQGNFAFGAVPAGTYTLTPTLLGLSFTPATATATVSSTVNATDIKFRAGPSTARFTISGTVSKGALPLASVGANISGAPVFLVNTANLPALAAVAANPALLSSVGSLISRTTTNATGAYSFSVAPGIYIVATGFPGFYFTPAYRLVTVSTAAVPNQNFTGAGVDATAPIVTIKTATVSSATGIATDSAAGSSGILTVVATLQDSSNRYFNWGSTTTSQFTATPLVGSFKLLVNPPNQNRVTAQNWSLLLPAVLPAGTYRLTVRAIDRAFKVSAPAIATIVKPAAKSVAFGATASAVAL